MLTGQPAFDARLLRDGVTAVDLDIAKRHGAHERMALPDALVALGLLSEADSYAALAKAAGRPLIDLAEADISPLALRLVSERIARRHLIVPVAVDNRTLTYATFQPFDGEADRDLSFAAGRRTTAVVATRSSVLAAV